MPRGRRRSPGSASATAGRRAKASRPSPIQASFVEYGGLVRPAMAGMEGAADGLVMGTAQVDGRAVDIVAYDYTVYAGTQSANNHAKISRMFDHAAAEPPAGDLLARWRRRAAARHEGRGQRLVLDLRDLRPPVRPGADGRHPAGTRLRRPCQPRRHVRRADRHQGQRDGHGRPAAGRSGAGPQADAGGDRPVRRPLRVRRHRHPGRGRGRGDRQGQALPRLFRPAAAAGRGARPDLAARAGAGQSAARLRRAPGDQRPGRRGQRAGAARRLRPRDGDGASRGSAAGRSA